MSEYLVYIGTWNHNAEDGIYRFWLDSESGKLTPAGVTRAVPDPFFLAMNAAGDRLYATNALDAIDGEEEGAISAFAIEPENGELTFINRRPSRGTVPCYISLDSSGKNLLTGNYNSGSVAVLPIEPDGALGMPSDAHQHEGSSVDVERQEGPHVHAIVLDPTEQWAYAPDLGIDRVMIYEFHAESGRLVPAQPAFVRSAAGSGPRHFAFHPSGPYAYLLNEMAGTLNVYEWDEDTGALTEIQSISTLRKDYRGFNGSADLQILPSGDFLYASNRGPDTIAIFRIDATSGRLTSAGHASAEGSWPWNLAIDPSSNFLLATNYESDSVVVFRIDRSSGALIPTGHAVSVPKPVNALIAPMLTR